MKTRFTSMRPVTCVSACATKFIQVEIDGEVKFFTPRAAKQLNTALVDAMLDDSLAHRVLKAVLKEFNVSLSELTGKGRYERVSEAKYAAYYILREVCRLGLVEAGAAMHKDYGCVLAGCKRARDLMEIDEKYRLRIDRVAAQFS